MPEVKKLVTKILFRLNGKPLHLLTLKGKKTKRLSPYLETELWDRDEILFIVKYEPHIRNKAL